MYDQQIVKPHLTLRQTLKSGHLRIRFRNYLFGMNDISNYALNVEEIISILEFEYNAGI